MLKTLYLLLTLLFLSTSCLASDIHILGLFKDKVVIEVDGQPQVLKVGESQNGFKVISSNSKECVLEINGQQQVFTLGNKISIRFTPSGQPLVQISQDNHGLYRTSGTVNGYAVNFLIDTGAATVALNINLAKELGLSIENISPIRVDTASGSTRGFPVTLQEIAFGEIRVYNVPAVVVDSDSPPDVLLGRTFLERMDMKLKDRLLELKQKY